MAKRFKDTEIWSEDWFIGLDGQYKLFWNYVCDRCDYAGIYRPNKTIFEKITGYSIDLEEFLNSVNSDGETRIEVLSSGKWFITGFIPFQYGPVISSKSKMHISVLSQLQNNNIDTKSKCYKFRVEQPIANTETTQSEPLSNPNPTPKDKEKEKDILFPVSLPSSKDSTTVSDINTSSENSNSSDSKKEFVKKKEKNIPEFAIELAKYLKEKIVESGTDMVLKESHLTGWANDFRLMVTADKKTVEDIRKKVDDIFMNEFWSKQIRSAGKLREQWNAGKLDNLKQRAAAGRQQTNEAEEVDRYASEKRYDSGRCRRYIDAMLRRLFPGDKWEEYIIPETDAELEPIWEIIVADGGYINGVKTKEAALKIVGMLRKYS